MIPDHIVELFKESKKCRKEQTKVINSLFSRSAEGRLVIQSHAPMFQAYKESVEKKSFTDKHVGIPKGIFCGQYFANNEQAMLASVKAGEIRMFQMHGLTYCTFNTLELETTAEKTATQHLLQAEKKLDKRGSDAMVGAWDKIEWNFQSLGGGEANPSSGSAGPLAITDGPTGTPLNL